MGQNSVSGAEWAKGEGQSVTCGFALLSPYYWHYHPQPGGQKVRQNHQLSALGLPSSFLQIPHGLLIRKCLRAEMNFVTPKCRCISIYTSSKSWKKKQPSNKWSHFFFTSHKNSLQNLHRIWMSSQALKMIKPLVCTQRILCIFCANENTHRHEESSV